jgi:hypothetical protein
MINHGIYVSTQKHSFYRSFCVIVCIPRALVGSEEVRHRDREATAKGKHCGAPVRGEQSRTRALETAPTLSGIAAARCGLFAVVLTSHFFSTSSSSSALCVSLVSMSDASDNDDAGGYTLEEYDIGPSQQDLAAAENQTIDWRMDQPLQMETGNMEARIRADVERMELQARLAGEEPPQFMMPSSSSSLSGASSSKTGPKAVLADYEEAKKVLRGKRMMENMRRERRLEPQEQVQPQHLQPTAAELAEMRKQKLAAEAKKNRSSDEEEEEDDDAARAAFEKYKQQRVAAVQASL